MRSGRKYNKGNEEFEEEPIKEIKRILGIQERLTCQILRID